MPIMTWNQSLDIGVTAMNAEHREILDAMNEIFDAHEAGKEGDVIDNLVAKLGGVCIRHFADEEAFMEKIGFPSLGSHKLIHKKLLEDFGNHAETIKAAGGKANADFFSFLKRWLVAHIKGIDIKYAEHANAGMSKAS